MTYTHTTTQTPVNSSSYRVKFKRDEFLLLVQSVKPYILYHVERIFFFSYDGFVMYNMDCKREDFSQDIFEAIEFSNEQWAEKI